MYRLLIEDSFAAAHQLRGYMGKCERLHGHNWKVQAEVKANELNDIGLAIDFKDLKTCLRSLLDQVEHHFLNEIPPFDKVNPSSENMAKWLYYQMGNKINSDRVKVSRIVVWESDTAAAVYSED